MTVRDGGRRGSEKQKIGNSDLTLYAKVASFKLEVEEVAGKHEFFHSLYFFSERVRSPWLWTLKMKKLLGIANHWEVCHITEELQAIKWQPAKLCKTLWRFPQLLLPGRASRITLFEREGEKDREKGTWVLPSLSLFLKSDFWMPNDTHLRYLDYYRGFSKSTYNHKLLSPSLHRAKRDKGTSDPTGN